MAVQIYLHTLTKRRNSTKQPSASGTAFSCLLKDNTTIESPTFILQTGDPSAYNYATAFGNFYYIDAKEYIYPFWHIHCTMDGLATYKTQIGNTSGYIVRANNSSLWNKKVIDELVSDIGPSTHVEDFGNIFRGELQQLFPCYVVTICGAVTPASDVNIEGATHWVIPEGSYKSFCGSFYNSQRWTTNLTTDAERALVNPMDYIKAVRWYPFTPPVDTTNPLGLPIYINGWNTGARGFPLDMASIPATFSQHISVPRHPQASTIGDFLNSSRYTTHTLADPYFGVMNIDANAVADLDKIVYTLEVDPSCGFGHVRITAESSTDANVPPLLLADRTGDFGVEIMFGSQSTNYAGIASGIGNVIGSVMSGNIFGGIASAISTVAMAQPHLQTTGSIASKAMYEYNPTLFSEFYNVNPYDPATYGYPICAVYPINTFSGYVQATKCSVSCNAPPSVKEEINGHIERGFYYE